MPKDDETKISKHEQTSNQKLCFLTPMYIVGVVTDLLYHLTKRLNMAIKCRCACNHEAVAKSGSAKLKPHMNCSWDHLLLSTFFFNSRRTST